MSAVGVASHNHRQRRTGVIHRPVGEPRRGDVPAVCGTTVLFARPTPTTSGPCCTDCWATNEKESA